ncbi:MAG: helix-turn-helix transcriptional regulator [Bacteroidota bacterium]
MKFVITNMVSLRCKILVEKAGKKSGLHPIIIELGEAEIKGIFKPAQLNLFKKLLEDTGLIVMDDDRSKLISSIKEIIYEMIYSGKEYPKIKYSLYLEQKLKVKYVILSKLFAAVKGTTINKYIVNNKMERVKELLTYDHLSLTEIAHQMRYSSVSHLSSQFKKTTGLLPSHFIRLREERKDMLAELEKNKKGRISSKS